MTLGELVDKLNGLLKENPDRASLQVYFDTDARTFDYHMAKIGDVYANDSVECEGMECISLHEEGQ